ncbi:PIG-L family deacetylase [Candidatus Woesearchaeota archaeon]|nr:PIG-L family deacetylase [Candidatus Woesearchaeota archaeon]
MADTICSFPLENNLNITILAPHIDDEIVGAGGSIAKHIDLGNRVRVVYISSGLTPDEVAVREKESERVAEFLEITDIRFLRQRPTELGERHIEGIVSMLRKFSTDFIYAPHLNDGDVEHTAVSQLAYRLLWLANGGYYNAHPNPNSVKGLFLYEVHRPIGEVHYFEDITGYEGKKIAALQLFASQLQQVRYDESAMHLNRYRGISSEVAPSVEAFQLAGFRNFFNMFARR